MKILFITDNFPPEVNAPATRTYEHCKEWVKQGVEVTVLTCCPNFPLGKAYPGYRNKIYQKETVDGMTVIRLWSYMTANEGLAKRTLDYISFGVTAFLGSIFLRCDVIIATSPQFFAALSGNFASFMKRKPWIMEIRDLWPESIRTVGAMEQGTMLNLLEKMELHMYKRAAQLVVVTDSFKDNLVARGIPPEKVHIIKNGVNLDLFAPRVKDEALIAQLNLQDRFVIGYTGTIGMAHKLDFILDCAGDLEHSHPFQFLFIGSGAEKEKLQKLAASRNQRNVTFLDSVSKAEIPRYLSIMDLALVPLRKSETFTKVIPSKIFETAAMQIPILLGVAGEAQLLIERYNAGLCFEPENNEDFIDKLDTYYQQQESLKGRFKAGCKRLALDFDRKRLAGEMLKVIYQTVDR